MSAGYEEIRALFAAGSDAGPVGPLADRRQPGADWPTIPVAGAGIEVTRTQAAAALFETMGDELRKPSNATLATRLADAVRTLPGSFWVRDVEHFRQLDEREFPEVGRCRWFAYRLCLATWYAGARSRLMTVGEVAAALYVSDLPRMRQADFWELSALSLVMHRALCQGIERIPAAVLIALGAELVNEFALRDTADRTRPEWRRYKQAMPDYHRRRFCIARARFDLNAGHPVPLIVAPDSGGYAVGLTPPCDPHGFLAHRAEW